MKEKKCEGIVLQSYPFKEAQRIVHLFTPDQGVIHLITQRLSLKRPQQVNLATSLCRGQYVYRQNRSKLCTLIDGSILNLHLPLRQSLHLLKISGNMLQAIHSTQLTKKPTLRLYHLLRTYLEKLPLSPDSLYLSFQLKLLKYEGQLAFERPYIHLTQGEYALTESEWSYLLILAEGRAFSVLEQLQLPPSFIKKMGELLQYAMRLLP